MRTAALARYGTFISAVSGTIDDAPLKEPQLFLISVPAIEYGKLN
jgi:hypothetical protein